MREIIAQAIEFGLGEKGLALGTWFLFFVTGMDAEVGRRIYTRMTKLINLMTPTKTPAEAPSEIEPYRLRRIGNNAGHRF